MVVLLLLLVVVVVILADCCSLLLKAWPEVSQPIRYSWGYSLSNLADG